MYMYLGTRYNAIIYLHVHMFACNHYWYRYIPCSLLQRDINEGRSIPPAMGQVGIRCVHCTHTPLKARAKGSVLYPKSVKAIHMAMRKIQRHHLLACPAMAFNVKQRYAAIRNKAIQSKKDSYTRTSTWPRAARVWASWRRVGCCRWGRRRT